METAALPPLTLSMLAVLQLTRSGAVSFVNIYMYTYVSMSSQPIPSSISGSDTKYLYEVNNGAGDFDFDFDIVVVASQNGTAREGKAHSRVVIKVVSYPRSVHYTS